MAMSPQTIVFGIQSIMRLGNAARRAYQDKAIDADIVLPDIDTATLETPQRALLILQDAILDGRLVEAQWTGDHDLVNGNDASAAGLAAQIRVIEIATKLDAGFEQSLTADGLAVLSQWSSAANRQTPLGRIGIELADIALDYIGANPSLFGADGNGARLIKSVAVNLAELLPDADDPTAPGVNFASGAIRIFVESGLRVVNNNIDEYIDETHLQDVATSILTPLIDAVANPVGGNQPWYDLRDEFLGPISAAAIDALARNQVAILGDGFKLDSGFGALTQSVLVSIKDNGLQDDFGKQGLVRVYGSMLDTVMTQPDLFLGDADSKADHLVTKILLDSAATLKSKTPPFNKSLGVELVASALETVSANAAALVPNLDAEQWTESVADISEVIIREVSTGLASGLASGDPVSFQRIFSNDQAAELIHIIVADVAATPGLVADGQSPEIRALVEIMARAMAAQNGRLFSADNWLDVAAIATREVASNPNRLVKLDQQDAEQQLLYQLISEVMNAAAEAAATGRAGGSVLFGPLLVEVTRTVLETAAGNAAKALQHIAELKEFITTLATVSATIKDSLGRQEWLYLFRKHVAAVIDSGELPDLDPQTLLNELLER
jgi:hypothetical protein